MNKENQIEEMAQIIHNRLPHFKDCKSGECIADKIYDQSCWCVYKEISEMIYDINYRKQSEGEWVVEARHFFDDYGDLRLYAIAHCSECKTPYEHNHDVDYKRIERPENLGYYENWEIDVEPLKQKFLEQAKRVKLHNFCSNCGAKMKGKEN